MSDSIAILCPGQGAQHAGMGLDFSEKFPAAKAIFDRGDALMPGLSDRCFAGPAETLGRTDISQPAIYTTSVACFAAMSEHGKTPIFAGLSLGEYTALYLAGVFDFETGLKLVIKRGQLMQQAAEASDSGMIALIGGDETTVSQLCEQAAGDDVLVPANFNAPGQIVASGSSAACGRLVKLAEEAGLRVVTLDVAGAFHSELMRPAADEMHAALEAVTFNKPRVEVWSNVTAQPHGDDVNEIKHLLVQQIVRPVRWQQTMEQLIARGIKDYVELAPGKALTGMARKLDRRLPIRTLNTAEALETQ